ncbi:11253_t:CDS:2 [Funneliformis caledonium]|uniref:11253_t:CDS:1 n=1 Tax=Funneliformis caledonium TaxID=1117310 RepID=A0A9N8ZL08_9GLOM|nr:11253_t:CDS:2 [Funneliformis caledonium]
MIASTLPSEILIEIFSYLHPKDLYSLLSVCKRYRTLLWSKTSTTTQHVWRSSRIRYILHPTFEPPENMCEQQYNYLLVVVNNVYRKDALEKWKLFEELLTCLQPILTPPTNQKIFLVSDVMTKLNEYFNIDEQKRLDWIQETKLKVINMTRVHKKYKTQFDLIRYSVKERIQRLIDRFKFYQVTSTQV